MGRGLESLVLECNLCFLPFPLPHKFRAVNAAVATAKKKTRADGVGMLKAEFSRNELGSSPVTNVSTRL